MQQENDKIELIHPLLEIIGKTINGKKVVGAYSVPEGSDVFARPWVLFEDNTCMCIDYGPTVDN